MYYARSSSSITFTLSSCTPWAFVSFFFQLRKGFPHALYMLPLSTNFAPSSRTKEENRSRTYSWDPNSRGKEVVLAKSGSRVGLSQLFIIHWLISDSAPSCVALEYPTYSMYTLRERKAALQTQISIFNASAFQTRKTIQELLSVQKDTLMLRNFIKDLD